MLEVVLVVPAFPATPRPRPNPNRVPLPTPLVFAGISAFVPTLGLARPREVAIAAGTQTRMSGVESAITFSVPK
jgi:hypothetical protein